VLFVAKYKLDGEEGPQKNANNGSVRVTAHLGSNPPGPQTGITDDGPLPDSH